jgi:hypothetical protein
MRLQVLLQREDQAKAEHPGNSGGSRWWWNTARRCWGIAWQTFQGPKFIEVATCALWAIWKWRNGLIFEGKQPLLQAWKAIFIFDLELIKHRMKPVHRVI